jgi:hypothetical protein
MSAKVEKIEWLEAKRLSRNPKQMENRHAQVNDFDRDRRHDDDGRFNR